MSQAWWYAAGLAGLANGDVDLVAHTLKALLVGNTYNFNQDTHNDPTDITGEITATGYTAGGQILTGKSVAQVANVVTFDSADPNWTSADMANVYGLVLYDDTADILLIYVDFEGAYGQVGGTFTYPVPATGWGTITAANAPGHP